MKLIIFIYRLVSCLSSSSLWLSSKLNNNFLIKINNSKALLIFLLIFKITCLLRIRILLIFLPISPEHRTNLLLTSFLYFNKLPKINIISLSNKINNNNNLINKILYLISALLRINKTLINKLINNSLLEVIILKEAILIMTKD